MLDMFSFQLFLLPLLLLPAVFSQDENPVACLQSGACFQVTHKLRRASWWFPDSHCRAPMAPPPLDGSMPRTKASDTQNHQQEAGGINSTDDQLCFPIIQVPGTRASPSRGGPLGRILRVNNCLPPKVFLVRPRGSCGG